MKTLYLLRHAKSSWNTPGLDDHDRPLNARGKRAAPLMGAYMAAHGHRPQIILCSSSRRTRDTLELLAPHLGGDIPVVADRGLYLASAQCLFARARSLKDTYESALLIGHNPGLEDLLVLLRDPRRSPQPAPRKFPTAALAVLQFAAHSWRHLAPEKGRLVQIARPRELTS